MSQTDYLASALDPKPQTEATIEWLNQLRKNKSFSVSPIPFSDLKQWSFEAGSGNLVHQSGKFFRILGLKQSLEYQGQTHHWEQAMIEQPEEGILGFATKMENGIRKFLVQAKLEPGTIDGWQISPTMQATKSNYSQVHQGQKPPYMELFIDAKPHQVLFDSLQSEHGSRFFAKKNRNLIIEIDHEVPVRDEFRWVSLRELQELAQIPNMLNMPCRSVLAAISYDSDSDSSLLSKYGKKVLRSFVERKNLAHSLQEIRDWVTLERKKLKRSVKAVGLNELETWTKTAFKIEPKAGTPAARTPAFSFGAVSVEAKIREVATWSQPLAWCERGPWISGLITQERNGVLHALVQNLFEIGLKEGSELGPTQSYRQPEPGMINFQPMTFNSFFEKASAQDIRYDSVQSSEGGRFYHEQNRLMILELPENIQIETGNRYRWMSLGQIREIMSEADMVNIELRELMACFSLTSSQCINY